MSKWIAAKIRKQRNRFDFANFPFRWLCFCSAAARSLGGARTAFGPSARPGPGPCGVQFARTARRQGRRSAGRPSKRLKGSDTHWRPRRRPAHAAQRNARRRLLPRRARRDLARRAQRPTGCHFAARRATSTHLRRLTQKFNATFN